MAALSVSRWWVCKHCVVTPHALVGVDNISTLEDITIFTYPRYPRYITSQHTLYTHPMHFLSTASDTQMQWHWAKSVSFLMLNYDK